MTTRPIYKVQKCVALKGGVLIGRVWQTVAKGKRLAVAERLAQNMRQDLRHQRSRNADIPVRVIR